MRLIGIVSAEIPTDTFRTQFALLSGYSNEVVFGMILETLWKKECVRQNGGRLCQETTVAMARSNLRKPH